MYRSSSRTPLRIGAAITAVLLCWHFLSLSSYGGEYDEVKQLNPVVGSAAAAPSATPVVPEPQLPCDSLHGLQDVFLVLRTGANEALDKLPAHFNTTLRCFSPGGYGIWSDYEEMIGGHHVMNALDRIPSDIMENHPDFDYYRRLQKHGRGTFSADELDEWATAPNGASGRDTPGWKLDKWKFLPVMEKAYRQRPDAKWYVFAEGDTYVSWRNLLEWLSKIDASKPLYLGHEMQIGDVIFAHGGSGYVISNPGMKKLLVFLATKPGVYEEITAGHWAGDCVLGKALDDAGVKLSWQYPNFPGESPYTMDYNATFGGSSKRNFWCYSVNAYHHISSHGIQEAYRLDQKWALEHSQPIRYGDVFHHLIRPHITPRIENWDNECADDEGAMETFADCRQACQDKSQCFQYLYNPIDSSCKTSSVIKLGERQAKSTKPEASLVSGWLVDRVDDFMSTMDATCKSQSDAWKLPD
ncbi:hypothetical protein PFICI_08790 [Pestalotiopsis fici W106-1]|uniref:N-acetylgalactosaminide beta-1,3-galactosyltransferase n=1 Tax=Pestalotiopsis fici (strain W106-1 / CGMCC3.15140) TaxID=1229662 RepID=W3X0P1_PESFW|nr:uncharacterized protein PFICI_08790 [Pestalotiopsis fici W106-1]ETS78937.1 hypothetical protein PFICI_08790 [Pestalotiopsis fici W106-1]